MFRTITSVPFTVWRWSRSVNDKHPRHREDERDAASRSEGHQRHRLDESFQRKPSGPRLSRYRRLERVPGTSGHALSHTVSAARPWSECVRVRCAGPAVERYVQPSRRRRTEAVEMEEKGGERLPAALCGADRRSARRTSCRAATRSCQFNGRLRRCALDAEPASPRQLVRAHRMELAEDPAVADASASTGASEPTPMHEEMEPLSDMELEDMTSTSSLQPATQTTRCRLAAAMRPGETRAIRTAPPRTHLIFLPRADPWR